MTAQMYSMNEARIVTSATKATKHIVPTWSMHACMDGSEDVCTYVCMCAYNMYACRSVRRQAGRQPGNETKCNVTKHDNKVYGSVCNDACMYACMHVHISICHSVHFSMVANASETSTAQGHRVCCRFRFRVRV